MKNLKGCTTYIRGHGSEELLRFQLTGKKGTRKVPGKTISMGKTGHTTPQCTHPFILQRLFGTLGDSDLGSCVRMLTNLRPTNGLKQQ